MVHAVPRTGEGLQKVIPMSKYEHVALKPETYDELSDYQNKRFAAAGATKDDAVADLLNQSTTDMSSEKKMAELHAEEAAENNPEAPDDKHVVMEEALEAYREALNGDESDAEAHAGEGTEEASEAREYVKSVVRENLGLEEEQ